MNDLTQLGGEAAAAALARQTPSKRLAAHRLAAMGFTKLNGRVVTLAEAKAQGATPAPALAARAALPVKPQAAAKPRTRIQVLADAVAQDPACKGKAAGTLALLADDSLASVSGRGLVKILAAMPEGAGGAVLAETNRNNAAQPRATRPAMRPSKASAAVWDRAIARNAGKPSSDALQGGAKAWGLAISKMERNA